METQTQVKPTLNSQIEAWWPWLLRTSARFARCHDLETDEVLGQALLHIARKYPRYDPAISSFSHWACLQVRFAAAYLARDRCRRAEGPRAGSRIFWDKPGEGGLCDGEVHSLVEIAADQAAVDPADGAADRERKSVLLAAVAALPPVERRLVIERFLTEQPNELTGRLRPFEREALAKAIDTLRGDPHLCRLFADCAAA